MTMDQQYTDALKELEQVKVERDELAAHAEYHRLSGSPRYSPPDLRDSNEYSKLLAFCKVSACY